MKLTGVAKGGPAEQAGVQTGDIIIELAGRRVENIYDYTYALDGLKIGTAVEVRVLRRENLSSSRSHQGRGSEGSL